MVLDLLTLIHDIRPDLPVLSYEWIEYYQDCD